MDFRDIFKGMQVNLAEAQDAEYKQRAKTLFYASSDQALVTVALDGNKMPKEVVFNDRIKEESIANISNLLLATYAEACVLSAAKKETTTNEQGRGPDMGSLFGNLGFFDNPFLRNMQEQVVKNMQDKVVKDNKTESEIVYEGAAGGIVDVVMDSKANLRQISIRSIALQEDVELLQELVFLALHKAYQKFRSNKSGSDKFNLMNWLFSSMSQ